MSNVTQQAVWGWYNENPWIWNVLSFSGIFVALRILRLAPAASLWGRLIRIVLLISCLLSALSYWNNAFGLILPFALMLGIWLWVEQTITGCLKAGHIKPFAWQPRVASRRNEATH